MKAGDKVVYIGGGKNPNMTYPKVKTEVVEILGVCPTDSGYLCLVEYEFCPNGQPQAYLRKNLRKVENHGYTNALTKKLANQPQIKEGIEIIEPQTV